MQFSPLFQALQNRQYFKLICGGSFSETEKLIRLIQIYVQAGVHAVDVSAHPEVVEAAIAALDGIPYPPVLMVSFPLDDDPHFRKIQLDSQSCIVCDACIPVCPTQVFSVSEETRQLLVDTPACYGCNRCVPVCPVGALSLDEFALRPGLMEVLSKPQVEAVEIHSTYAEPAMVDLLYDELGLFLQNKLISVCFRPQQIPLEQAIAFVQAFKAKTSFPLIIQVDGNPMSATDDPEASREALEAARKFAPHVPVGCYLTISGGINIYTAQWLRELPYQCIQGVGMGTYARQQVCNHLSNPIKSIQIAANQVKAFQPDLKSAIMELKS